MSWQRVFNNPESSAQKTGRAVGRAELDDYHRLERAGSAPPWPGRYKLSRHARAVADAFGEWDEASARAAYESGRRATKRVFSNPIVSGYDDPFYIVHGMYEDSRITDEFGSDGKAEALAAAKKLLRSPLFEGDIVRVITRDGQFVWEKHR